MEFEFFNTSFIGTETVAQRNDGFPFQSMPNLSGSLDESSLNPMASEFIPSYLKKPKLQPNNCNCDNIVEDRKKEETPTTTLSSRDLADATYLYAQRQLFELLHQLGNKFMPLKSFNVSLAPDGLGINVNFTAEQVGPLVNKPLLDETVCQNCAMHVEIGERSSMPRRLPNVLTANFMTRMGAILNDKMECRNGLNGDSTSVKKETINPTNERHNLSSSTNEISSIKKPMTSNQNGIGILSRPNSASKIPILVPSWNRSSTISRTDLCQMGGEMDKVDAQLE